MGSINAQIVARKISENVGRGKRIKLGEIIKDAGYSSSVSETPQRVTETKAFKAAFALEQKPILDGMQAQINKVKAAIANKNLNAEEYRTLVGSLDILIKNYQLLSGGATERNVFVLPSQVIERNNISVTDEKSMLKDGSTEPL